MLRSINSKFYTVVAMLLASFGIGYALLAYFLHLQSNSYLRVQNAIEVKSSITTLNECFHKARFWEKLILSNSGHDAEKNFGMLMQQIRSLLDTLNENAFSVDTKGYFKQILVNVNHYESVLGEMQQLITMKKLLDTRLKGNFQSMTSTILQENDSNLLRPLFSVTHFFISYQQTTDLSQYKALLIVTNSLKNKVESDRAPDIRLTQYIKLFIENLGRIHDIKDQISAANVAIESISIQLTNHFNKINLQTEILLQDLLLESEKSRNQLQLIFLVSTVSGVVFLLFILHLLKNNIIGPVKSIAKIMHRVQNGQIESRFLPKTQKTDEIIEMGLSFNATLNSLEARDRKLLDYQIQLEEKIVELSKQREEQRQLAQQLQRVEKMEALGTLAGGVAHDLNNILSGIVSYPELLLLELPEDSPYRKPITVIQESGNRAVAIVQDLLTLARRGAAIHEVTNLNTLVTQFLAGPEFEKLHMDYPQVTVQTSLQEDLFNIKGSPVHLLKTIMNLIINGVESIQVSGTITISTENRYLSEPVLSYDEVEEGDYAVLTINDTGKGIPSDDLERIFEPFFTKKEMGRSGSGLGLAVVWGTVKDHNGYIDVKSVESKGTTFTLYFPITRLETGQEVETQRIESFMGNGELILVVDDIESQRDIASEILTKLGYTVQTAASGEEAVTYLQHHHADILILDMLMPPGIDGLETYRQILETHPRQKAIIASGYSETKRVQQALELGAETYIKKPYSLKAIGVTVQKALQK